MQVNKLITRVINSLAASDTPKNTVEGAKAIANKIRGRSKKSKKTEEPPANGNGTPEAPVRSSTHMSIDSRIENLGHFIQFLGTVPGYTPNEADLSIEALQECKTSLEAKSNAVALALPPLERARIARNKILYDDETGLVALSTDVKMYVKSVFGGTSPEYKQISRIRFTSGTI